MSIQWNLVKTEAATYLQKLIQINTTNPPGNELEAARYLAELARENGLHAEIQETAEGRGNLLISYQQSAAQALEAPESSSLLLLSHLDVVGADEHDWEHGPFSGEIVDDVLWGRGTIDTKQLTIMELMALILLKRENRTFPKDILLVATADEESGSTYGLLELLKTHGELFRNKHVISEGGGFPILVNGIPHYLCETGQKGICQITFHVEKSQSTPYYVDNRPMHAAAKLVRRITQFRWAEETPKTTRYLLDALLQSCQLGEASSTPLAEKLRLLQPHVSPFMDNVLRAMTENTMAPTIWKGGRLARQPQGETVICVDCRLLPGVTREMVEKKLAQLVLDLPVTWQIESFAQGYETDFEGPLFDWFDRKVRAEIAGSKVVPFIATGSSDGRHLLPYRSRVFGFSPMLPDVTFEKVLPLVHGVNERIPLDSLVFGVKILYEAIGQFMAEGE
ncbi:M20/M25/M40 family metallo-hydrolase [Brevibacillus invocatus]|uniref:M20/M25/M40 family metallo-hydrolase n=1 Tax=Brevibacillus invocatus TaxID=173959 RepID=A0A3M8BZQ4_9BACL|nr:M20/M25/M40 family metallo-hydrolase [Brevibacillus invocatus]RNB68587.1 M20/M25/M40 family metallo-hydrolase [Brevibacillus invocatus]